ncbi:hypothetical protein SeLEV6574_g05158 [Synchytrium endobioticum]|uniref:Major facilitator superfamily (MFS) profile domain-containing protein n=1 Tax=Synchytrium endobioticum TaxID=286115 RepID=A0A507CVR8_9FUNG|nr:hypothetical protein SeLEV6574_g05158 [Synchytrium endobioticum]
MNDTDSDSECDSGHINDSNNGPQQCPVVHALPLNHPPIHITSVTFLGATLSPAVTRLNIISYLLAVFISIMFFVYLNASSGFLLSDVISLPRHLLGRAAGTLSFADELFSITATILWGIVSDVIGRRNVYVLGYFLMGLGLCLHPLATRFLPDLLLARLVFASGASSASCMLTAVLADYGTDTHRGKLAGLVGMASGLGAVTGALVLLRLPGIIATKWFDSPTTSAPGLIFVYESLAIVAVLFGLFLLVGMRGSRASWRLINDIQESDSLLNHTSNGATPQQLELPVASVWLSLLYDCPVAIRERKTIVEIARDGFLAARDPSILLGYIGSCLARGDSIIITIFLSLWVNKHFQTHGLCPGFDPNDPKGTCREAYILASSLNGAAQLCALVAAPLVGYLLDKIYPPMLTLISLFLCGLGYFLLSLSIDPTSPLVYPIVMLIGLGEIAMIVVSLSLATGSNVPRQSRGAVAGFSSFWGAIGILCTTQAGGWAFDGWKETAPFFLMATVHAIAFLLAAWVASTKG